VDLEFTDDQEELRQQVRAFLDKEAPIGLAREVTESGEQDPRLWGSMVALDWPALAIDEDCGGIGLGFTEVAVVIEELGGRVVPGPYLATVTQFAPAVREAGDPEQRRRFLGAICAEGSTGTLALADHPRRWGVGDLTTTAVRDGDAWVLAGTKVAVLGVPAPDEVAVAARVAAAAGTGEPSVGLFVVPGDAVTVTAQRTLDATRPLATVDLGGVRVAGDRVLGEPGSPEVATALRRAVEEATAALALETVGTCQALFDLTLAYVKDRHQFGVPIGSFQVIKHKMADLFIALERARALAYYAVAAVAEDDPKRTVAVAMAKAASDDCQRQVCQDSIQSFGGIGFTWEHDAHLYVKRAKSQGALLGSATEHRLSVARHLGVPVPAAGP
jgi:alkylation response protein AidB-like acyl-CoA dehydrogenase